MLIILCCLQPGWGQINFNRGVNITNWFQAGSARQIQFSKFTRQDFTQIKSLGCDVVRLPINLHFMTLGAPNYTLDPLFLEFLDQVVDWAEELQINLILDNHTFDPQTNTDPNVGTILVKVWKQMAEHYKDRSEYILYEILNEPHGITTTQWGQIQQNAIDAIRQVDNRHTIIVGASGYNSYNEMKNLPAYSDTKLIYTFHFYDPFIFTHQGASWNTPSMVPLAGVPFPYSSSTMPACPAALKGSWVESAMNNYANDGTVAKVKQLIDIAVDFKNTRNATIFCGEFGVYIPNSNNADRVYWYEVVRKYLEEKGIPWTIWDYTGGFGIFKKGSDELFEHDLNTPLLTSLGFNVPEQKPFVLKADSIGFPIYTDIIGKNILESGSNGTVDFYNASKPNNDKYCLYWTNAAQYNAIGFNFKPDKDLSKLVSEGYALDFIIRGTAPGTKFDIRFWIPKPTDPADHPWRMRVSIDDNTATWNRYWQHVRIPPVEFH
ncbi:MAG: glycoside hydrolase family 5 protein [Bacteroidales bacterium]|nr:glycoside hydrolase family 5 protein [Bacteroidales bacterium]